MPTLNELASANVERQKEWDKGNEIELAYRGNEMAGEVGEAIEVGIGLAFNMLALAASAGKASNIIKKLQRERMGIVGSRSTREELASELSDIIICVSLIAAAEHLDLDTAVTQTFNKKSRQLGFNTLLPEDNLPGGMLEPPAIPRSQGDLKTTLDAIDRQNAEFNAVDRLSRRWASLQRVAIVDDDYPQVRHEYESAMRDLIDKISTNGRLPTLLQLETTKKMYVELKIRHDELLRSMG